MPDKICGASCTNTSVLAIGHDGWCSYDTPYVTIRELRADVERLRTEVNVRDQAIVSLTDSDQQADAVLEVVRLRTALERAWAEHERAHLVCSVFSPELERRALDAR